MKAHPEWAAQGLVGEEIQAFSDFLVYILDSQTILSDWAVLIFDTASGFVDVYKGKNFSDNDDHDSRSSTMTIRFEPGHYQPLLPSNERPSLGSLLRLLDEKGVLYVVTDGNS